MCRETFKQSYTLRVILSFYIYQDNIYHLTVTVELFQDFQNSSTLFINLGKIYFRYPWNILDPYNILLGWYDHLIREITTTWKK